MAAQIKPRIHQALHRGLVVPACPLALNARRELDERRQRALFRYYLAAGAGGLAVGVHTTQFAIREPKIGLFRPVLELAAAEMARADADGNALARIAGVCAVTKQAVAEAALVRDRGYHAGLLSLAAFRTANENDLIAHCRAVAEIIPLVGFYLQPAAGGRALPYSFWRRFAEIENVVAIKIAPFNRYQSCDVIRAIAKAGRDDIALYTGNDDNIVMDLLTPFRFLVGGKTVERRIVGGLLGHWAVWTKRAVEVTDANAAFFDAAHNYAGCIPGLHEVLRRQGLLEGLWCLDPNESLSPGQREEIDRVYRAYPHLNDDEFVAQHRDEWLGG